MRTASAPRRSAQRGATLVITLIMLALITMFVVAMMRLSNSNLKIVGNMQAQRALESSAQQAVETDLSNITFFDDAVANTGTWPAGTNSVAQNVNGYTVTVARPVCVSSTTATGYSATSNISPEDTNWEIGTSASDSLTGAQVTMVQGVKMRMPAGNCP
jgi:Tfp pilus assembly protein PilX